MSFQELSFNPFFLLKDPNVQTIFGCLDYGIREHHSVTQLVPLSDGDQIALEVVTPSHWKPTDPTVLMVHGLCGSHKSVYLLRLVNRLTPKGLKTVRFNMRGSGSGKGLAKNMFHSGRSDDVFESIRHLRNENPESPIIVMGFSLGGNLVLKMIGELGSLGPRFVKKAIAVCPPVDLLSSAQILHNRERNFYGKYFVRLLQKILSERQKLFRDIPKIELPENISLMELDALFTAPMHGFSDVHEYYERCSAKEYIDNVETECRVLLSQDDPIVCHQSLDHLVLPSNIQVYKTKNGGHMGYLATPFSSRGFFWLDSLMEDWILE